MPIYNPIAAVIAANVFQVIVDFGPYPSVHDITQVVIGLPWITSSSVILFNVAGVVTPDHGFIEGLIEGLTAQCESIVPGVGFTIHAYSPFASAGRYVFDCIGF